MCVSGVVQRNCKIAIGLEIEILREILREFESDFERERERVEFDEQVLLEELERIFLGWVHFVLGVLGACKEDSRSCKDLVEFVCVSVCVFKSFVLCFFLGIEILG